MFRCESSKDFRRLAAIRYLGGILQLPTFWHLRIYNDPRSYDKFLCPLGQSHSSSACRDPHSHEDIKALCNELHSFVNGMCKIGILLLQDLAVDGKDAVCREDLVVLDIEGIHHFLLAYWLGLPLVFRFLKDDDNTTVECLQSVLNFGDRLQRQVSSKVPHHRELISSPPRSERSKAMFPEASGAARKVLLSMKTDNNAKADPPLR